MTVPDMYRRRCIEARTPLLRANGTERRLKLRHMLAGAIDRAARTNRHTKQQYLGSQAQQRSFEQVLRRFDPT